MSTFEITVDREDAMAVDEDPTNRVKKSATKRKGRGFGRKNARSDMNLEYETLEGSRGTAQRSVEGWIVLVTNVHEELTEEDVIDIFSDYGPLKNIHLNLDRRTGYVKGYALIEYSKYEEAREAIKGLDGSTLQGKTLKCDFAFVRGTDKGNRKR